MSKNYYIYKFIGFLVGIFGILGVGFAAQDPCKTKYELTGEIINVKNVTELNTAITTANNKGNVTIVLEDGVYNLTTFLYIKNKNITIRSKSGIRQNVVLKGGGMKSGNIPHVFLVTASDFKVMDLSLGNVKNHGIQIQGEKDADNLFVHNVRFFDTNEQMLKGSFSSSTPTIGTDNGIVECSLFEYSAGIGPQYYIGGIDVHNGKNWIVRYNTFKNIKSPTSTVAEHAVHFWSNSENTIVDSNIIINCDRGIGFGLGSVKHIGGIIKNNLIVHDSSKGDVGIGLESASGVKVYNNTIFHNHSYANAIEYRFAQTSAQIKNNLTNKAIAKRDNGNASLSNNIITAKLDWFLNPIINDYTLTSKSIGAKNAGEVLQDVLVDINLKNRDLTPDIGAFEGSGAANVCTPDRSCTTWSNCENNQQSRTCVDKNNCNILDNKPAQTQSCNSTPVCKSTQHLENGICVENVQACSITNGKGEKVWSNGTWGNCNVKSCNEGYKISGNSCILIGSIITGDYSKLTIHEFIKKYNNKEILDKNAIRQLAIGEFSKDSLYRISLLYQTDKLSYNISTAQLQALDMSKGGIFGKYLTFEQINNTTELQISQMHGDNYQYLNKSNISKIPLTRISKLTVRELSLIKKTNPDSLLGFTASQMKSFNMAKSGIYGQYFTYEQFKSVTLDQISTMHGDNYQYLSPENVALIPDFRINLLTSRELSLMKKRYDNLTGLTKQQLDLLLAKNNTAINNIIKPYIKNPVIGTGVVGGLTPAYCVNSNNRFDMNAVFSKTIYVDINSKSVTQDGTSKNPYKNLNDAVKIVKPGEMIQIAKGTYPGGNYFTNLQGSLSKPIKIQGQPGAEVIINGGNTGIQFVKPSYLILENLTVANAKDNGINIDDGGNYSQPAHHIIIKNVKVKNIGNGGNNDHLKMSGVDYFYVMNSQFSDANSKGSGIDMVGCHTGYIFDNNFYNLGSNFIQTKGGSSNILIKNNLFKKVSERGINMGGSTGAEYFRPTIANGTDYEAKLITVVKNIFIDTESAVAYVGCIDCNASYNIIYKPRTWVFRILQETISLNSKLFKQVMNGIFTNNIIVFQDSIRSLVNIGPNTKPQTFKINGNLWYNLNNPKFDYNSTKALLPVSEIKSYKQIDPMFVNLSNEDFTLQKNSVMYEEYSKLNNYCK